MIRFLTQGPSRSQLMAFLLIAMLGGIAEAGDPDPMTCDADNRHGTEISWVENRLEAQREALNSNKLLMVMQISGDFTKPTFT